MLCYPWRDARDPGQGSRGKGTYPRSFGVLHHQWAIMNTIHTDLDHVLGDPASLRMVSQGTQSMDLHSATQIHLVALQNRCLNKRNLYYSWSMK